MKGIPVWDPIVSQCVLIAVLHILSYLSLVMLQPKFIPLEMSRENKAAKMADANGDHEMKEPAAAGDDKDGAKHHRVNGEASHLEREVEISVQKH
mmetsp:Transcript_11541/g.29220  ORF Transcript_11541/g.29220 Transcript_11541/m.29220 type:complete len:95 (+) Transcript_11541:133-417(+)